MINTPDFIPWRAGEHFSAAQLAVMFPTAQAAITQLAVRVSTPDLGPQCPDCLNPKINCLCAQLKESAS